MISTASLSYGNHCHTIPPIPNGTEQQEKWVAFWVSMDRQHVNEYIYIYVCSILFYSILFYLSLFILYYMILYDVISYYIMLNYIKSYYIIFNYIILLSYYI